MMNQVLTIKISLAITALLITALVSSGITYTYIHLTNNTLCTTQPTILETIAPAIKPQAPHYLNSHDGKRY
jgi:hypothetical protein